MTKRLQIDIDSEEREVGGICSEPLTDEEYQAVVQLMQKRLVTVIEREEIDHGEATE